MLHLRSIFLLISLFLAACSHPTATQMPWCGFQDAWRISNGKVEVVVVPSIGRMMSFGPAGGRNLLWTQPDAARHHKSYVNFDNFGGEKIWLWPQLSWPPAGDGIRYQASWGHDALTLISEVIPPYQVRIIRKFSLHAVKPELTITTTLISTTDTRPLPHIALWSVAQTHLPDRLEATLASTSKPPHVQALGELPAWPIHELHNHTATFVRTPSLEAKSGMNADALAAFYSDTVLAISSRASAAGPYDPNTQAQIYVQADTFNTHPPYLPPYAELEFVAPWPTETSAFPTLTIRWSLRTQETF